MRVMEYVMASAMAVGLLCGDAVAEESGVTDCVAKIASATKVIGNDMWYGHRRVKFEFKGRTAWVVEPSVPAEKGCPWTWTMQWAEAYVERTGVPQMLSRGWHHATIDLFDTRMTDTGVEIAAAFQKFLVETLGFDAKACLIGPSWGGFFSTRYAGLHPENVAKIYLDAPLLSFDGFRAAEGRAALLERIGPWTALEPADRVWSTKSIMPLNFAEALAKAGIPILLVYGGQDQTVDPKRNCEAFAARFEKAGGRLTSVCRPFYGHHPHGLETGDDRIVSFLTETVRPTAEEDLKVLMIGNSFSISNIREMPSVAAAMGCRLDLASMCIGGCSLERHWNNLVASTNADFKPYGYERNVRGKTLFMDVPSNLLTVLKSDSWDVVTLQQASHFSWRPETYEPFLGRLVGEIRRLQPKAKIMFQETWSYTPWDRRLAKWGITADDMYAQIHAACRDCAGVHGLPVIPTGAAVDLYRKTLPVVYREDSFGGDPCGGRWGGAFVRDEATGKWKPGKGLDVFHLGYEGEYLQALVWTAALFDVDVTRCPYVPKYVQTSERAVKMRRAAQDAVEAVRCPPRVPRAGLDSAVVYQLVLRTFTHEGTFAAAREKLGHVRAAGMDVVYLTPFVAMDTDADRKGWSPRQIASGFDSPKNPYRIADYDRIDPEYGDDADFKAFNDRAHELGMKVYMDLVYLHCGPNNVLKDLIPDAFQKNADGTVKTTIWNFPYLNFESRALRDYLIESMRHWIRLGCDGFRCDVGDQVPIDFWIEATAACRALKDGLVMINEGTKVEWLEKAFDACYAWPWSFATRSWINPKGSGGWDKPKPSLAARMDEVRAYEAKVPPQALMLAFLDNHDTANDDGDFRFDRVLPVEAGNALFALTFLRRGVPLVFNGNEIADNARSSFFGPVGHPARTERTVDWSCADRPDGRNRLSVIRRLAEIRHTEPAIARGTMVWQTAGEKENVLAFVRGGVSNGLFVAANLSSEPCEVVYANVDFDTTDPVQAAGVSRNGARLAFAPWGWGVYRLK